MDRSDRAKQFAPFEALKGLKEALREKEQYVERESRTEISEDTAYEIESKLIKANKGDKVGVKTYVNGRYFWFEGELTEKNCAMRYVSVDGKKIFFDDVFSITV